MFMLFLRHRYALVSSVNPLGSSAMVPGHDHAQKEFPLTSRQTPLDEAFAAARQLYFPRWSAGQAWRIHPGPRSGFTSVTGEYQATSELGLCDRKARAIWVTLPPKHPDFWLVLLHECCHAVRNGGHGMAWQHRMCVCAARAMALGQEALATQLTNDALAYAGEPLTASDVYDMFACAAVDTFPYATTHTEVFTHCVASVAQELGMLPGEFIARYRRLKAVYRRAFRGWSQWLETAERRTHDAA